MPELAEVEYYRRQWDCGLGARITRVQLHGAKRVFRGFNPREIVRRLAGSRLTSSSARGKQMLFRFAGDNWLGLHLGMSGTLRVEPAPFRPEKHDHLVLQQAKRALVFRDPRQFGRVRFHHGETTPDWWSAPAPEIASDGFNARYMAEFLQRHARAPIKAVLLLQSGFPGIGNWMADEILWRARIAPSTRTSDLDAKQQSALRRATRFVSREAMRIIGRDYGDPPRTWLIHQRWKAGGTCPRDGTTLSRATIGGRTTAWCLRSSAGSAPACSRSTIAEYPTRLVGRYVDWSVRRFHLLVSLVAGLLWISATVQAREPETDHVDRGTSDPYTGDLSIFEEKGRGKKLQIDRVMDLPGIKQGSTVADIGAGSGWFTVRSARRVGQEGLVYAVEINRKFIRHIERRAKKEKLVNIRTILGKPDDPMLPANSVDAVLLLKTYHEIEEPIRLMRRLRAALRPGALVGVIDRKGIGTDHGLNADIVVKEAQQAGYELVAEHDFVKSEDVDYFLIFR